MQPRGSKAKRAAARQRVPPHRRADFLKMKSVTEVAARRYHACSEAFLEWVRSHRRSIATLDRLDSAMADYCSALFFDGALPFEGRQALYGYAFRFDRTFKGNIMMKTKRAISGWERACKSGERDPLPWEVWTLLANSMFDTGLAVDFEAACAGTLAFDLYLRPSETLALTTSCLVLPARKLSAKYNFHGVIVHPFDGEHSKASKTGELDDTVLCDRGDDRRVGTGLLLAAVGRRAKKRKKSFLFPSLSLAIYEARFRAAADRCGLLHLKPTPHMLRHGRPSTDALLRCKSLQEIQQHGRWKCERSVSRYEKHGRLLRMIAKLSAQQQQKARSSATGFIDKLMKAC